MKKKLFVISALLCALALCGCTEELEEANPVVQASGYVSENSEMLGNIGENMEDNLAEADAILDELQ